MLVLVSLGPTPALAADGQLDGPFVFDSTESTYPFVMRLEGVAVRKGDVIEVELKGGLVRSTIPTEYKDEGLATHVSIAFGLGNDTEKGWRMTNETADEPIAADLRPGESLPITAHRFVIKSLETVSLTDTWLVARLTVDQKLPELRPGLLSSYACAAINLNGETPKSKDRKKRMIENYAHTC